MAIFLKNVTWADWKTSEVKTCSIRVGTELAFDVSPGPGDEIVDMSGKIATKSFACGHHHVYSGLARGMPFPQKPMTNFTQILENLWWNLDRQLDHDMIRACALTTAMQSAKAGVTYVIDHHSSPNHVKGSLDVIASAFDEVGVGHLLCVELSDRDGTTARENGLSETEDYLRRGRAGLVGLHASFTVGNALLADAIDMADRYKSGIHIHVAEDLADQKNTIDTHHKRVVERLADAGGLDSSKTILGHCLHLNPDERKTLFQKPSWIAVNTESNLNNRVGHFSSEGLCESQIMLGTDGMHSDMIASAQAHYWHAHAEENASVMDVYTRLRNVHHYLANNDFTGDGDNNIVIFNYDSPTDVHSGNWLGHFFYGLRSNHVESVIAQGKWIVRNRQMTNVNESEVLAFTKEQARRLWEKL